MSAVALYPPTPTLSPDEIDRILYLPTFAPRTVSVLGAYNLVIIVTTAVFFYFRANDAIKVHGISLIVAQACFVVLATPLVILQMTYYPWFPCAMILLGQTMIVNWGICIFGRVVRLRQIFTFHQSAIAQYNDFNRKRLSPNFGYRSETRSEVAAFTTSTAASYPPPLEGSGIMQFAERHGIARLALQRAWIVAGSAIFINTTLSLVLILVVPGLLADDFFEVMGPPVIAGLLGKTRRGVDCHSRDWWFLPGFTLMGVFIGIIAPVSIWSIRNMRDTYGLRAELLTTLGITIPCFIAYWVYGLVFWDYTGYFTPNTLAYFFFAAGHGSVILPLIQLVLHNRAAKSLALNMESFQKVLSDPTMFASLKELAVRDFCSEQTIFLEELRILTAKVHAENTKALRASGPNLRSESSAPILSISFQNRPLESFERGFPLSPSQSSPMSYTAYPLSATPYDRPFSFRDASNPSLPRSTVSDRTLANRPSLQQLSASYQSLRPSLPRPGDNPRTPMIPSSERSSLDTPVVVPPSLVPQFSAVCDVFIRPGAPMELNLSAAVRSQCVNAAAQQPYTVDMFDAARDQVIQSLFFNTFPKLVLSKKERINSDAYP
ncbi:hypothetical protein BJ742DRAFT_152033 [Cladochytrium replicatum]|nr:hypothetical protein BJ742DRAFT_152033 [Cladochytrium replicatum]